MPNPDELEGLPRIARFDRLTAEQIEAYEAAKKKQAEVFMKLAEPMQRKEKPILLLDFDGVIHSYTSGWQGIDVIPDPPVEGAIEFLWEAIKHFRVCIYSTRSESQDGILAMQGWLGSRDIEYWKSHPDVPQPRTPLSLAVQFPTKKPSAFVGLDDRVLTFNGVWPSMPELLNFKPWNKK